MNMNYFRDEEKRKSLVGKISAALLAALLSFTFVIPPALPAAAAQSRKTGAVMRMVTRKGRKYLISKSGTSLRGWQTYGGHLYYFSKKNGSMQHDKTIDKIMLADNGRAVMTLDASVKYKAINMLDKSSSRTASKSDRLLAAYNYLSSKNNFGYDLVYPNLNDKSWIKKYANQMLSTRKGNCYGFACTFAALADALGYKPEVITTRVRGRRDHQSDGFTRHAIVRINGLYYDPELKWAGTKINLFATSYYPLTHKEMQTWSFSSSNGQISGDSWITHRNVTSKNVLVHSGGKYYYFDKNKKKLKGLYYISGKLYNFNKSGFMTNKAYKALQKATKSGTPWSALQKIIGNPKQKKNRGSSCYGKVSGKDWQYIYKNAIVNIFVANEESKPDVNGGTDNNVTSPDANGGTVNNVTNPDANGGTDNNVINPDANGGTDNNVINPDANGGTANDDSKADANDNADKKDSKPVPVVTGVAANRTSQKKTASKKKTTQKKTVKKKTVKKKTTKKTAKKKSTKKKTTKKKTTKKKTPQNGFVKKSGKWSYYQKGKKVAGLKKISGKYYYFDKKGTMQSGSKQLNGVTYYFSKAKDGKAPALVNKTKKVSGKTLYFSNTGKGFISCGNTEGNQAVASVIEGAKLSNSMTQDQKLSVVYNYILNKYNYTISDPADLSSNQWIYTCAYNMFKYGDAKCYNYAALTGLSANALGFNVRFETGVAARSAGGEKTEHAWVVVNDQYVLDSCYDDVNNKSGNQYFYKTYDEIRDSEGSEYQVNKTFTLSD